MNIILYKGFSQYGVLRFFTDEMGAAFIKLGHNAIVVDLTKNDGDDKLNQLLNGHRDWDFVFSFNGAGIILINDNRSLYDVMDVPFVTALVDHPCHHIDRLNTKINHLIVTCTDKVHLDFLSFYYPQGHIKVKSFMPQAGTLAQPFNLESFDNYLEQRTIPVLFVGSFIPPERSWINLPLGTAMVNLLNDIADCILAHDCIAWEEACNYVLKYRAMELSQELQKTLYSRMLPMVEEYIRAYCRCRCFETLAKAEIPVVSCREGWKDYLPNEKYKSITFIGAREYREHLHDLQKTRLFLTPTTNLLYGASERLFNAMLNGAVTVSQANYSEEFVDGQDSVLYKWTQLDSLPGRISTLLDNPETTWQIAKAAKEKAEQRHTWLNRAEKVLSMVTIYKNLCNLNRKA